MTELGFITIPQGPWIWPSVAVLLVAMLLLVWSYRGSPRTGTALWMAFGLKILAVLVLAMCLIEPLWSGRRAQSGANPVTDQVASCRT